MAGGSLNAEIVGVVSNHEDLRAMAEAAGLPFHHVPVTPEAKAQAEQRLLEIVDGYRADVVVLARYMQVLSDGLCRTLLGRAIDIHHSVLPGFTGAKPYHQAIGRDAEALALARAVRWHSERRVLLNEGSTVVFR